MVESLRAFKALCNLITDYALVYRIEPDGRPVFEWGSGSMESIGYTPEDFAKDPFPFADPEDAEVWARLSDELMAGRPAEGELRGIKKNGEKYWVHFYSEPFFDEKEGRVVSVVSASRDITKEKAEREERERLQAQMQAIADQTTSMIYIKDLQGRYTFVNHQCEKVMGHPAAEIIGHTDYEFTGAEKADEYRDHDREAVAAGGPVELEECGFVEGVERTYMSVKFPLRDAAGRVYALSGISTDVSRLKNAEEELRSRDQDIRQAYVEVIAAVTGNKLLLMLPDELDGVLGEPITNCYKVKEYSQMAAARDFVRRALRAHDPELQNVDALIVAVGEALTNGVKHAGATHCQLYETDDALQVVISDEGGGIDFKTLPKATLLSGYSTAGTLGMGFTIMLDAADRLVLASEPGSTSVVLEVQPSLHASAGAKKWKSAAVQGGRPGRRDGLTPRSDVHSPDGVGQKRGEGDPS